MSKKTIQVYIDANGKTLVDHGRKEISSKNELEKYPIGSLISYETLDGRYAKGGFITNFKNDYFIYILLDFSQKYRIRYNKIKRMWVGNVFENEGDYISFKEPCCKTKFPVKIGEYVVKYVASKHQINVFISRDKYKTMVKWYDTFASKNQ